MRIALVINASAGAFAGGLGADALRARVAAAGLEAVPEPDPALPLPERLRAAAAQPGIAALAVAGGDGTLSCAAAVLAGGAVPLALLPLGTMNLLAKDLGLPLDLDGALDAIAAGRCRRIDVGTVNGHVFVINSLLGMPARMQRHREAERGRPSLRGALRWGTGLLRHLGRYPKLTVTGHLDGVERRLRVRLLAVVNNDYVEAPGRILQRAPLDGGGLTLYALARLSPWRALRLGLGFVLGDWRRLPGLERVPVSDLTIDAPRALRVMNDGEVLILAPPLRYRLRPRALCVIVPEGSDGRFVQADPRADPHATPYSTPHAAEPA